MPVDGRQKPQVCIVTSAPVSNNPRVVKEADALAEAGFSVTVLAAQHSAWLVEWDAQLTREKKWRHEAIRYDRQGGRFRFAYTGLRTRLFDRLWRSGWTSEPIGEWAQCRVFPEQLRRARKESPDIFIAHNLQALPVAWRAARYRGVPMGFDAEDDHYGEFHFGQQQTPLARLIDQLQARYLPRCAYVTAASDGMADALVERYGIVRPTPVYNVFPWRERDNLDGKTLDRKGPELSLYWYSQTVGMDRGLQDVLRAAAAIRGSVQVHIRGKASDDVRRQLTELARECRIAERVFFHDPVHPHELLARTAEHDVGLALEQPVSPNRLATVTNKMFFYMLAGMAVAATDTPGQRKVLEANPDAGFLYPAKDWRLLAEQLQTLHDDRQRLEQVKQAALAAARTRWNWEIESKTLVATIRAALPTTVQAAATA